MMHRIINMTPDGLWTDHVNGNKLDNRQANLRSCSNAENARSRNRKLGASGFRGVTKKGSGWQAAIMVNYEKHYLGIFDTAENAARAYDEKAKELHRSFAGLNFPQETSE